MRSKPTTTTTKRGIAIGLGSGGDGGRLLLFWAIFLSTACSLLLIVSSDGMCIPREREALLSFKRGLIDFSNSLSSWSWVEDKDPHRHGHGHGVDCCHWRGVVCHNSTGRVLQLRLARWETETTFSGNLSPSLLDLKQLTHLDLSFNHFQWIPIPRFLGSLQSLTYLNLSHGWFGGMIPQQLGNLSNLHSLDLECSYSSELRSDGLGWVTGLSKLQYLDLSRVNLSKVMDWFQAINTLPSLKQLHLPACGVSGITIPPTTLPVLNISHLSVLDLSGNSFSWVPEWVFSLTGLTYLDLSVNSLSGPIPVGLCNLTALTYLDLSWNSFNSSIPKCLFDLNKLEFLNLQSNSLKGGITEGIRNLTALANLDLSSNSLSGPIPVGLGDLTRLTTLDLTDNSFNSSIPKSMFHLNKLQVLRLRSNSLEGVIPEGIGNMTALSVLDLTNNSKLEGVGHVLIKSLGNLCSLRELALSGIKLGQEGFQAILSLSDCADLVELHLNETQLTGKFGNLIDKLAAHSKNLATLDLSSNSLHGPIPESLGQLAKLQSLSISDNQLMGDVTQAHFSNLTQLIYLSASRNKLSLKVGPKWIPPFMLEYLHLDSWQIGPLFPQWLQSQDHLYFLQLSGVGISSTIPDWFQKYSPPLCYYYNLSHNQIYGDISKFVQGFFEDTIIDLGYNRISGLLPPISPLVARLDLSNNHFSGSISHFLCHKPSVPNHLVFLDLGKNNMSGEISDCWMNWRSLVFLNFEYNEFTGQIPSSIQSLGHLHSLHLHNNHLQGELPTSLRNCTSLVVMDLAENDFLGNIPSWMGGRLAALTVLNLGSNRFFGKIPRQLCALTSLQVLVLAHNNLSGNIPTCFNNFTGMTIVQKSSWISIPLNFTLGSSAIDHTFITTKDRMYEYSTILGLMTCMDLSNNFLSGEIPKKLTSLTSLRSLNLSYNRLTGRIPETLGAMKLLESIDLSTNYLFGGIPSSMSDLTFISYFNVSNNNLKGKIPLSTQLQSLNASSFSGNQLCGPPLNVNCSRASTEDEIDHGNRREVAEVELFYVSIVIGFIVGFWFVWAPLLFKKSWRQTYFRSVDSLCQRIIVLFNNY